jgi:hypothetical protein
MNKISAHRFLKNRSTEVELSEMQAALALKIPVGGRARSWEGIKHKSASPNGFGFDIS